MTQPQTFEQWLEHASARFAGHSDSPRLDAEILLAAALDKPRSHLVAWPDHLLEGEARARFGELVERRERGEPVAHILGRREFWSLPLRVTPDVLIPRPDTETLVEVTLESMPADTPLRVLDLGTGSGAIALALKFERPLSRVVATDASPAALEVARTNAADLNLAVDFRAGRWWEPVAGERFDIIVSNPPYIAAADPHLATGDVRFEPKTALVAGAEGLDDIRAIATGAGDHLLPGGRLFIEHGYDQAAAVREIFAGAGLAGIRQSQDFGGNDRITCGQWPGKT